MPLDMISTHDKTLPDPADKWLPRRAGSTELCLDIAGPSSGHADADAAVGAAGCCLLLPATGPATAAGYCWWDAVKTTPEVGPGALAKTTMHLL
ncbi:hypothetical protein TsFJ059_007062 [Trichoderma semiorbis]|uniref:Uncharacterized protein n=1 Tax=Trichoderma semiorbis TaxID=1491008 RepID=A0A9P8HN37_9HYPO|nr:hypothetical protein TsFJ059_007062 [Trichoderma semiorbis]